MDDTMNTVNETAISSEPETQQETVDATATDTQPEVQQGNADMSVAPQDDNASPAVSSEPFLEIKYLKENKTLTRDEAKNFAEIGMHYSDVRETLERVAAIKGMSVQDLVTSIETEQDEAYRRELAERFGDDEETINIMMEHYQNGKQEKIDAAKNKRLQDEATAEQNINTRLANEFIELQKEFPELLEFADLPESVRRAAAEGKDLTHAYLLHQHRENKKIAEAKASQAKAAASSAGSMATSGDAVDNSTSALMKGLWG